MSVTPPCSSDASAHASRRDRVGRARSVRSGPVPRRSLYQQVPSCAVVGSAAASRRSRSLS
ncbi:Uncharacterised protein [Mycobacteroides abscessus]|nr:Uncharacterised protein [Mycobacteroides abscessus]